MKRLTTNLLTVLTFISAVGIVSNVSANDYLRINREARTIERKAKQLMRETDHYRATPHYEHLVCDVEDFIRLSQHITDLVDAGGLIRHIRADVNELDRTFHHVENLFDRIELAVARGQIVKCGNTAHVKRLLNNIEACIHVMQEDIAILEVRAAQALHRRAYNGYGVNDRVTRYNPGYYSGNTTTRYYYGNDFRTTRSYDYGRGYDFNRGYTCPNARPNNGIGFSIGGGSSRIHIRF